MSSGRKIIWSDEEDWDNFKRTVGIQGKVSWDVYSPQARFAREYATMYTIRGNILITLVNSRNQLYEAQIRHDATTKKLLELYNLIQDLQ